MRALNELIDERIGATNYLLEVSIGEYLDLVKDILRQNEYQRKRVKRSQTIYSLLKEDLVKGCVIPPIVLALTRAAGDADIGLEDVAALIVANKDNLLILDGLQRTLSIIDVEKELLDRREEGDLRKFYSLKLRIEVYVGINRIGILYRMLTLNTGQTPMSLRQQIEILYLDYSKVPVEGVELIREADDIVINNITKYNFRDTVEGFNAYLERNELPISRADILENIKGLEKLAKENKERDIFKEYLGALHFFITTTNDLMNDTELGADYRKEYGAPFGKNIPQLFKKSQSVSGFGAAIGKLKDFGKLTGFVEVKNMLQEIKIDTEPEEYLEAINVKLYWIKNNTTKIGNAQRMYFQYYFRDLLNPEGDSFCNLSGAIDTAFQKYVSQTT